MPRLDKDSHSSLIIQVKAFQVVSAQPAQRSPLPWGFLGLRGYCSFFGDEPSISVVLARQPSIPEPPEDRIDLWLLGLEPTGDFTPSDAGLASQNIQYRFRITSIAFSDSQV